MTIQPGLKLGPYEVLSPLGAGGTSRHWIGLRLVGRESARDALEAKVTVVSGELSQIREVRSGASYLSQSDSRVFFGLGSRERVDRIEIRWPSGKVQENPSPEIDRYLVVVER